jgi:putative oxidoreductase
VDILGCLPDTTVEDGMTDLALLLIRVVTGGLLAGHGAQKLFGSFGGPGLAKTADSMESLGLRPGTLWASLGGLGELVGGLLTVLGLGGSLWTILTTSSMKMATFKAHSGKPIWAAAGGAELPVVNTAVGAALTLTGPGCYSLDRLFGIKVPRWLTGLAMIGASVILIAGLLMEPEPEPEQVAATERA